MATDTQQSSNSRLPSQIVTATAFGVKIAIAAITKQNVEVEQYTTLNEIHSVLADESLGVKAGSDFTLKYYGLGVKGSQFIGNDANGIARMLVNQHQPIDCNAFYPIPLVVRELSDDLTADERANYRMRVVFTKDSVTYVAYYLRVISFAAFSPSIVKITKDPTTGNEDPDVYVPTSDYQHPTPITPNSDGTVPLSNQYVSATGKLDLSIDASGLAELRNACSIMFGDESYAAPNEYYVCTGIDTPSSGQTSGSINVSYTEAVSAIIAYFITETHPRDANANGAIEMFFDIGASAPLLLASS
ncbi:hypothetical protein [Klebsiella phage YC1]|nr:hypothetical protein [Klebsiella phage YC1]